MSMIDPASEAAGLVPITIHEEKELKRVHDLLCDFLRKKILEKELNELQKANESIQTMLTYDREQYPSSSMKIPASTMNNSLVVMTKNENRIDEINAELSDLINNPYKKISVNDLHEVLKELQQKVTKKEVEEMIWECDEDLDQCLNWGEFKLMFSRNVTDRTGLEPSRMFNLAQFLIYDKNRNGNVSVDETMHMLYARYGRNKMELKLKELFGDNMPETGRIGGGEIDYSQYLKAVERIQMNTFLSTTKGRMIASKTTTKKQANANNNSNNNSANSSTRLPAIENA